jgi:hypothetical protein
VPLQRLQFGGEAELLAVVHEEQGLLAETVARQQQAPRLAVPEREREHPAQVLHAVVAEQAVQVEDDLGVAAGMESEPTPLQVTAQVEVVVDFPVADDPQRAPVVAHRLAPGRAAVDDGQPPVPEAGGAEQLDALAIGTPMRQRGGHRFEHCRRDWPTVMLHDAGQAAHAQGTAVALARAPGPNGVSRWRCREFMIDAGQAAMRCAGWWQRTSVRDKMAHRQ